MIKNKVLTKFLLICNSILLMLSVSIVCIGAENTKPKILFNQLISQSNYLPDYSYAGYQYGLVEPNNVLGTDLNVLDFGAVPNDGKDDTKALLKTIQAANNIAGPVIIRLPKGRLQITEILHIQRSNLVIRGQGMGNGGSELYFPRPLKLIDQSNDLDELRAYLKKNDKRQVEPAQNIDLPFSEYSWSGGFIWTGLPNTRSSSYLDESDSPAINSSLAKAFTGRRGEMNLKIGTANLKVGDVIQIRWFSPKQRQDPIIESIYGNTDLEIGSHHWSSPNRAVVIQTTSVTAISDSRISIGDPLLHDITESMTVDIASWQHLTEIGIEDIALIFPDSPSFGHHLEQGYNGIYLTGVRNSWIRNISVLNADSGILTYNSANVSISNIHFEGNRRAHYSVHIGNVHNVLVKDLIISNPTIHSLSLNTQSTRSVFLRAHVLNNPVLDQHAGANHQNLFDNISFDIETKRDAKGAWYPIWDGSGASYWQPGHGRYNTTWNLKVNVKNGADTNETVRLLGTAEGPDARIVGISGNRHFIVDYRPIPYMELINEIPVSAPSLYEFQRNLRLSKLPKANN